MNTPFSRAALTIAPVLAALVCASCGTRPQTPPCVVGTPGGDVQGVALGESCAFLGIPFAAPPVGSLRWQPPQPPRAWLPNVLNATTAPPMCPQVTGGSRLVLGDEDCLMLNIWMPNPSPTSHAPVIVWIPAGAFTSGSANLNADDVRRIAHPTGAIVVAMNYRVGPLGFLGHPALSAEDANYRSSGNYGLLDQRAALGWVHEYIASFGGNPDDVTIAGQSAGAHSVSLHVVSPRSAGSFSRAIMQSGYASTRWRTLADAESLGQELATVLGCTDLTSVLPCLRSKTVEQVLFALPSGEPQFAETTRAHWGPVVDGLEIPDQPRRLYEAGKFSHVPVVIETSGNEGRTYVDLSFPAGLTAEVYEAEVEAEFGTAYASEIRAMYPLVNFSSPKDALARLTSDAEGVCEARRIARLIGRTGTPVRLYTSGREVEAATFALGVSVRPPNPVFGKRADPCDFWDRFFLASVAGGVPASLP